MLLMRSLSAVALWRWPKDRSPATPLQHVRFQARSPDDMHHCLPCTGL